MLFPDLKTITSPLDTLPIADPESAPGLRTLVPVRGPSAHPVASVAVDSDLVWVTRVPTALPGAARPSSPGMLVHFSVQLMEDLAVARGAEFEAAFADDDLVDAAAEAVAEYLSDIPELPLIGDPFGGEEGTD